MSEDLLICENFLCMSGSLIKIASPVVLYMIFSSESLKYLKLGFFSSDLGDAMVVGLSNALQLPIVVLTSVESWQYYTIQHLLIIILFSLLFLQCGPSHYSLAVSRQSEFYISVAIHSEDAKQDTKTSCHRGRRKKCKQN